ncbi:uncharacterized protein LY79DRAFT_572627 [Colletotrichum navitas]|uniref:Uncharacterized protein n=1 Tax=Colletotrichum navitas TaxID=681940 RepID=A0AAD8PJR4_9PEZI|nr:uncharacterized protein LY79DRAFT_572627 [Colletotrichum navitas]KAK1566130.1 hypothetical protein LY79DRAFT_572627 [Colletotrichum navitas]
MCVCLSCLASLTSRSTYVRHTARPICCRLTCPPPSVATQTSQPTTLSQPSQPCRSQTPIPCPVNHSCPPQNGQPS